MMQRRRSLPTGTQASAPRLAGVLPLRLQLAFLVLALWASPRLLVQSSAVACLAGYVGSVRFSTVFEPLRQAVHSPVLPTGSVTEFSDFSPHAVAALGLSPECSRHAARQS
jgi:hypothetical protein